MSHLITFSLITSYTRMLNMLPLNFSKILSVNTNLNKVVQSKSCVKILTLQSWQHCPWAQTASPFREHVVALQQGFMHSWNAGKKTKQLTWFEPDHRCEDSLLAGPCQMKCAESAEHTSCPEIPALTPRPSSGNKTLKFMCFRFSIAPGVKSCKEECEDEMTQKRKQWTH